MSGRNVTDEERGLIDKAAEYLAGGGIGNASANVIIRRGKGGRVWDVSGNEYVDFILGSGPMLVGHVHPEVVAAVRGADRAGQHLHGHQRTRHPPGRGNRQGRALRRQGEVQQQRFRGDVLRHAYGPVVQEAGQNLKVRGRVPRDERLRANEHGAHRTPRLPAPHSRFPRHTALDSGERCLSPLSTTSRRRPPLSNDTTMSWAGLSWSRFKGLFRRSPDSSRGYARSPSSTRSP